MHAPTDHLNDRIRVLEEQLRLAKQNTKQWFDRYERLRKQLDPATPTVTLALSEQNLLDLGREATMRGIKPDILATRLIAQVVRDKLFAAVLDQ